MTAKPDLLTVEQAKSLPLPRVRDLFERHLNPGQLHFLKLLGFAQVLVKRVEGMYYYDQTGRSSISPAGSATATTIRASSPRASASRTRLHEICMAFMSQYTTALAHNLATIAPGDLDIVFLTNCGPVAKISKFASTQN
jgi:ornithine--oxo-acid transaminase